MLSAWALSSSQIVAASSGSGVRLRLVSAISLHRNTQQRGPGAKILNQGAEGSGDGAPERKGDHRCDEYGYSRKSERPDSTRLEVVDPGFQEKIEFARRDIPIVEARLVTSFRLAGENRRRNPRRVCAQGFQSGQIRTDSALIPLQGRPESRNERRTHAVACRVRVEGRLDLQTSRRSLVGADEVQRDLAGSFHRLPVEQRRFVTPLRDGLLGGLGE